MSKVFIKILLDKFNKWLHMKNVIQEEQAGYKMGYSTINEEALLHFIYNI